MAMVDWLSLKSVGVRVTSDEEVRLACVCECECAESTSVNPISPSMLCNHLIDCRVLATAMYSASHEESAAVFCRLLAQSTIEPPSVMTVPVLSLIHISEPTRRTPISYAVFCL